jgi:multiple antibiotic resistance protein
LWREVGVDLHGFEIGAVTLSVSAGRNKGETARQRALDGAGFEVQIGRMGDAVKTFLQAFIPLFVAIDPIGLAAVFSASPGGAGRHAQAHRDAGDMDRWRRGAPFPFLGQTIFAALGITSADFQVAGGLILFVLAARDLLQPAAEERPKLADDFGVVPLGMPLIAGPASITTLILLAQTLGTLVALVALAANLVLVVLAFAFSAQLARLIGAAGLRAISKIISMLLAAIAVSMIRHGLK